MHVYTLNEYDPSYGGEEYSRLYYASKRKAEAKAVELAAKQAKEEAEDWIANPCKCGDRRCDYRSQFFLKWSVHKFDLTELSMRELMKIELADADED